MGWAAPPWTNTALRVFFLLLLPFFLGFYVLPHSQAATGQPVPSFSGNRSSLAGALSFNYTHTQEAQNQFAQIESVFPLANYLNFYPLVSHKVTSVCFQDAGSRIELANGTVIYPDFYWEVSKPSFPPVIVQANSTTCANTSGADLAQYTWSAQIQTNLTEDELGPSSVFHTDTRVQLQGEVDYGLLQGLAIVPAAYLFVWYPLFGIWRKIKEGMTVQ